MVTTTLKQIKVMDGRTLPETTRRCINYYSNPKKTLNGNLVTAINCNQQTAVEEFLLLQHQYEKITGKSLTENANHRPNASYIIRQSFAPGEVDYDNAHRLGVELAQKFLNGKYQCIVTTHVDTAHIHNNIYFNAVGLDLKKFNQKKYTWRVVREISDKMCLENNLSVVVPNKNAKPLNKYSKAKDFSYRDILKMDIDKILSSAKNYDDFLKLMSEDYYIKSDLKHLAFLHKSNGQQRYIRSYSIDKKYSQDELKKSFSIMKIPNKKIKLTFLQTILAKNKAHTRQIFIPNDNISYSQKKANIKNMFHALHTINEFDVKNYKDISLNISILQSKLDDTQSIINSTHLEINRLQMVLDCAENLKQYSELNTEYNHSLLKEKFFKSHEEQLNIYKTSFQYLMKNNIDTRSVNTAKIKEALEKSSTALSDIEKSFSQAKGNLKKVLHLKHIVDDVVKPRATHKHDEHDRSRKQVTKIQNKKEDKGYVK